MTNSEPLPFTGERFTPECVREIAYEHWHRYAFAQPLASGRRVLDAACGEGFGSALLAAAGATRVLGVDLAPDAIAHARGRYPRANLQFREADVTALDDLPDATFDLLVSFETLEHVQAQERMLAGFARLLAADGLLLISTPDKAQYSDASGQVNPFHLRELYLAQFEQMLAARFAHVRLYAQKLLFQSVLWSLDRGSGVLTQTHTGAEVHSGLNYPPLYYLAVCSQRPLPELPALALFGDAGESVYRHYDEEVRKHIAAGHRIAELEAENARLRARIEAADGSDADIAAIVVSHQSESTLDDCLHRLRTASAVARIVVIDNASRDASMAIAQRHAAADARVHVVVNADNPGFATACNQAAACCTEPWLAFVNPDCLLAADALFRLRAHLRAHPEYGLLGADLIDAERRRDDAARRRLPSLRALLAARGRRDALAMPIDDGQTLQPVEAVSGALMLLPRARFAAVGGFDPGYRLHAEDLDLCKRIADSGAGIAVANDVQVLHLRGVSSRSRPLWVEWQKHHGLYRYLRRHDPALAHWPLRTFALAVIWLRFAVRAPGVLLRTPRR